METLSKEEKLKAYQKAYYQANKEKIVAQARKRRQENPQKDAEYRAKKRERLGEDGYRAYNREKNKRCKERDPEKHKRLKHIYYENNKDKYAKWSKKAMNKRVEAMPDNYIKRIILWDTDKSIEVPEALIAAKRLEILIKRRIKDENSNTIKR